MVKSSQRPLVLVSLLSVVVLTGCAQQAAPSPDHASASPAPAASAPAGSVSYAYRLPIAEYSLPQDEQRVIQSAQELLTRACMKGFGIDYTPAVIPPTQQVADRRYGISDRQTAVQYGYRFPPEQSAGTQRSGLTPEEQKVLTGNGNPGAAKTEGSGKPAKYNGKTIPDEGCLGKSISDFRKTYAYEPGVAAASRIAVGSYKDSLRDPKVEAAMSKWSHCMKEKGYDYTTPIEAVESQKFEGDEPSEAEKKTALADFSCKERTGLLDTWFSTEQRIQRDMIKENEKDLRTLKKKQEQQAAAARKIVAEAK
ncbi:hypothetical protein ACFY3N_27605 [Streptomyces sp. NPDC000348]|uniref:hypothetical protein n=1 Tax=Streptomyces sp. NPDC000348 TaxID=3364538 RepID=UPI0036854524